MAAFEDDDWGIPVTSASTTWRPSIGAPRQRKEEDEDEENEEATGEGCGWLSSKLGGRAMEPGTLDTKDPGDPPSDDDSIQAVWGDPGDREVLEVTSAQELRYKVWWSIREEERVQWVEVD